MKVLVRIAGNVSSAAGLFSSARSCLYIASFWIRSVFARVTAAFRSASFWTTMFCAILERDGVVLLAVALQLGFGRLDLLALLGEPLAEPVVRLLRRR